MASEVLCQAHRSVKGDDGKWVSAGEDLILPRAHAEALKRRGFVTILDAGEAAPAPAAEGKGRSGNGKGGAKPPAE